jgi:hypothetical protein
MITKNIVKFYLPSLRKLKESKIKKSNNQNKTVWDVVELETGKTTKNENICRLNIDGKLTCNHQEIVDTFKKHLLSA